MIPARGRPRSSLSRPRLLSRFIGAALVWGSAVLVGGCSESAGAGTTTSKVVSAPAVLGAAPVPLKDASTPKAPGDPGRGAELVVEHQCNRCHEGTGPAAVRESHCVNCHREILAGTFPAPKHKLSQWQQNVGFVRAVPSLVGVGARLGREWIAGFLLNPHDIRPMLEPSMPRLALSEADARDIAAHLVRDAGSAQAAPVAPPTDEQLGAGRKLMEERACGACHVFSGAKLPLVPSAEAARSQDAVLLAPDLARVRERWNPSALISWLKDPRAMKSDTGMPQTGFDDVQASAVAAYLLHAKLDAHRLEPSFQRLPVLERSVSFAEVDEHVFRRTCRHCHGDPSVARGDGGPGNTGGLGFKGRGIDFSSYRSIAAGYLNPQGERRSLFEKNERGVPRLIAALLARHDEQRGGATGPVRGMPLGLPALSAEQIQLVDSWVAQGRPR